MSFSREVSCHAGEIIVRDVFPPAGGPERKHLRSAGGEEPELSYEVRIAAPHPGINRFVRIEKISQRAVMLGAWNEEPAQLAPLDGCRMDRGRRQIGKFRAGEKIHAPIARQIFKRGEKADEVSQSAGEDD